MKSRFAMLLAAAISVGCSHSPTAGSAASASYGSIETVETTRDGTSTAATIDSYKADLAQRISAVNSTHVYTGRPQALLRSVIVVKYVVDAGGNLVRSEILRSNHDRANESIALTTLRSSAPFPKPAPHLLRNGRLELAESWLFNDDGRFQLRSIALAQMDE